MARPRKPSKSLTSLHECELAMDRLGLAQLDLEREIAARDGEVAAAMNAHKQRIEQLQTREKDLVCQLQTYYMAHTAELEKGNARSYRLQSGVFGRRKGNRTLKLKNRSWTWDAVMVKLRETFARKYELPPGKPKPDKDKIKRDLTEKELGDYGLRIVQNEDFYAEPFRPPQNDQVE